MLLTGVVIHIVFQYFSGFNNVMTILFKHWRLLYIESFKFVHIRV